MAEMWKKYRRLILAAIVVLSVCLILSGCMPGDGTNSAFRPAGFFTGIWHGWIAPVSLIWSLFDRNVSIYEIYNTGFFYDLGYYAAVIGGFGCLSLARKRD